MRSRVCCRGTPAGTLGRREIERVEWAFVADGELAQRYELVREEARRRRLLSTTSSSAIGACYGETVRCDRC